MSSRGGGRSPARRVNAGELQAASGRRGSQEWRARRCFAGGMHVGAGCGAVLRLPSGSDHWSSSRIMAADTICLKWIKINIFRSRHQCGHYFPRPYFNGRRRAAAKRWEGEGAGYRIAILFNNIKYLLMECAPSPHPPIAVAMGLSLSRPSAGAGLIGDCGQVQFRNFVNGLSSDGRSLAKGNGMLLHPPGKC
jgi:hypothetical protein